MKNQQITFTLKGIKTIEFATFEESFKEGEKVEMKLNVDYGIKSLSDTIIMCSPEIQFIQKNNPLAKIKIACYFTVDQEAWDGYLNIENNSIIFPKGFADHLLMLSFGTLRGVFHAKTEGTVFNQFLVPTINIAELHEGDLEIKSIT